MKLETLFDNFEMLAEAPNGVQKLRELILQLAVRGKLVPQDENDEPASVLLEKIKSERERLIKEKKSGNPSCRHRSMQRTLFMKYHKSGNG